MGRQAAMVALIAKQVLFAIACLAYGAALYLLCGLGEVPVLRPFAFTPFGLGWLVWPVLALLYIGIQRTALRWAYLIVLALHCLMVALSLIEFGTERLRAQWEVHDEEILYAMSWYGIGFVCAWYALWRAIPRAHGGRYAEF